MHTTIGKTDAYVQGKFAEVAWSGKQLHILYRGDTNKVYFFNTEMKTVYETTYADFKKIGFVYTIGGTRFAEKYSTIHPEKNPTVFLNLTARKFAINNHAITGEHNIIERTSSFVTGLDVPADSNVRNFVSYFYGLPITGVTPVEMKLAYVPVDAESKEKLHSSTKAAADMLKYHLKTLSIGNEKLASNFFDVPRGFKKVDSQMAILGGAAAADDFAEIMFSEGKRK